ncbi:MAG TPA: DUF1844 domain-containing protein [Tepidisphaeraceae bacterium]|jgi:hypothetical protein|nr:DUF1844 domain-containing protein [Tepidisphaeraceae bacterium]
MAEEQPSLHIDTDWKKQAQEEKRKLAEQEKQRQAAAQTPLGQSSTIAPSPGPTSTGAPTSTRPGAARGGARELPPPSFATLVQSIVTQILFYLGDLATRGGEPSLNLDMAKHHIDTLGILEDKTKNNLTPEEQSLLDAALYETRMRYVSVASQMVS